MTSLWSHLFVRLRAALSPTASLTSSSFAMDFHDDGGVAMVNSYVGEKTLNCLMMANLYDAIIEATNEILWLY